MRSGSITGKLHTEGNALSIDFDREQSESAVAGVQTGYRDNRGWDNPDFEITKEQGGSVIDSDRILFGTLVEQHQDYLFSFVYSMMGRYHDAQDLTAKAFFKAFKGFKRFRKNCSFKTWVTTVAINLVKNYWRDRKNINSMDVMEEDVGYIPPSSELGPEDSTVREENKKKIQRAITKLPMKYRPFVVMKHLHQMSYTEIAEINEVPVTTVRNRIYQGKLMLEKLFVELKVFEPGEGGYEIA